MGKKVTNFLNENEEKKAEKGFDIFGMFNKSKSGGGGFKGQKDILSDYQDALAEEKKGERKEEVMRESKMTIPEIVDVGEHEKEEKKHLFSFSDKESGSLKTNLITDESSVFFDWKGNIINMVVAVTVSVVVVGGVYFWLQNMESKVSRAGDELVAEIKELNLEANIFQNGMKVIDEFQKKLSLSSKLLEKHIYWTNFFDFLEDNTLSHVDYVKGFFGDLKGEYKINSESRTYSEIDNQVDIFNSSKFISNALVIKASLNSSGSEKNNNLKNVVGFDLSFEVDKEMFYK